MVRAVLGWPLGVLARERAQVAEALSVPGADARSPVAESQVAMIVTQSHKRRSFVGCLNAGTDLVEAIRSVCVDNTIFCGFLQATGYLKDPKLRWFDADQRAYRDAVAHHGTFQLASLACNISLVDRQTSITCHVSGSLLPPSGAAMPLAGELVSATIVQLEFALETVDDLRLYRQRDDRTGLDGWLHLEFAQSGNPIVRERPPEAALVVTPAAGSAPATKTTRAGNEDIVHDVREGDFLNHPTLGRCVVVGADLDDRLTIRLESGRIVELHTGLIDIAPPRTAANGERTFAVSIRRRR